MTKGKHYVEEEFDLERGYAVVRQHYNPYYDFKEMEQHVEQANSNKKIIKQTASVKYARELVEYSKDPAVLSQATFLKQAYANKTTG